MRKQLNIFVTVAAAICLCGTAGAQVLNEWTFEEDASGQTLSASVNSGSDGAAFSADTQGVTQTDGSGGLVCANIAAGESGLWTDGAILSAPVMNSVAGETRYLRYNVDYDMTSESIDSGTLIGLAFSDSVNDKLAGFALGYRVVNSTPPAGVNLGMVAYDLALTGRIAVIAEVNLTAETLNVWYNLSGDNTFAFETPAVTVSNLTLRAMDQLEFWATGDFISGASECAVVENIRTASTWGEITERVADYTQPPVTVVVVFDDQLGGRMLPGQTNTLRVVIRNTVSPATSVSSSLSFDGPPGDFTIIPDNAPVSVGAGRSITNSYQVIAHTIGSYQFAARAVSDGTVSEPVELAMLVGLRMTGGLSAMINEDGGFIDGRVEPGETFELIITNVNSGAISLTQITNRLTAVNSSYFSGITPLNTPVYSSLDVGESATTTYRMTCSADTPAGWQTFTIVNRTADNAWTNQFQIDVFREALLRATPVALTIRVAPGETASETIVVVNEGNVGTDFTVTSDGRRPTGISAGQDSVKLVSFFGSDTRFDEWDNEDSEPLEIGFDFPLFGTEYQTFSANQAGYLTLESTNGATATLNVFKTADLHDPSTIRYDHLTGDRLVIAWGHDSDKLECQVILSSDGTLQYLYERGEWGAGEISVVSGLETEVIDHTPGQFERDAVLLTQVPWVTVDPSSGMIAGKNGEQSLAFTADATGVSIREYTFTAYVNGDDNSAAIEVTVIVESPLVQLDVPPTFDFSGPTGSISAPAVMTITNSGNVELDYSIIDRGLADAGYTHEPASYQWREIPDTTSYQLDESELGTLPVEIGFPFIFFGETFTRLVVDVDGTVTFEDGSWISPHSADLTYDDNSSVRVMSNVSRDHFYVTWENMAQPGGGDDQTFQLRLERDGTIRFNYQRLEDLGEVVEEGETNTVDLISHASEVYTLGRTRVIYFDPASGTIPIGGTADISLTGDARNLEAGGSKDVIDQTTLDFNHSGGVSSSDVAFTATNSMESVFPSPAVQAAMWGTDNPVVSSELTAEGARTLSWPAPADMISRMYTVEYTTSLADKWLPLAELWNLTEYVDDQHNDEPVIFYRVTVQ